MDEDRELAVRDWLPRTAALLVGALALATASIAAYVGALHQPAPRDVPVGVVVGDQRAEQVMAALRARTDKIKPIRYDSPQAADDGLTTREVYAVLTSGPDNGLRLPSRPSQSADHHAGPLLPAGPARIRSRESDSAVLRTHVGSAP
ncbi:hypothetical protein [Micromonospora sp. DT47]|uniref:hypothetical protein n=1 Tax=Micromonospora sp. DT47 TaxID=3393431 RepID=UPI003CEF4969